MSALDERLALQDLDAALDQIPHRSARLPERVAAADAAAAVARLESDRAAAATRADTATTRIEELEAAGATRTKKKVRLEQQLKTVIAPREAEALMHEIAVLDAARNGADDEELALLDEMEVAEASIAASDDALVGARVALEATAAELAAAEADLAGEHARLREQRDAAAGAIVPELLRRYESLRASFKGTAIARVTAGHCGACHLDLSRAFLDRLKTAGPDALIECEQCGRLLVH
jgi:uncharacterized protein